MMSCRATRQATHMRSSIGAHSMRQSEQGACSASGSQVTWDDACVDAGVAVRLLHQQIIQQALQSVAADACVHGVAAACAHSADARLQRCQLSVLCLLARARAPAPRASRV